MVPADAVKRFTYRCDSCGGRASTYFGGPVLCVGCGRHCRCLGVEVLVRLRNGRRRWKRPWNVRQTDSAITDRDF